MVKCAIESCSSINGVSAPLNAVRVMVCATPNKVFAVIYTCALLALLYHHLLTFFSHPATLIRLSFIISDAFLAFIWVTTQCFRMRPIRRVEFPENLEVALKQSHFPGIDVFICTADPKKEPPITVVNTALSVMAYDYPSEKVSVYVSDDGGSELTLLALMKAAEFGRHWLPFCRERNMLERSPNSYFESNHASSCWDSRTQELKEMYENMKDKIENPTEIPDFIESDEAFSVWRKNKFTRQQHPTVIKVLLESRRDTDITGEMMPNLVYISREKSICSPHRFKAGALNVLLRVSAIMTNKPIILTLDCDTHSNDPCTPLRALCYFYDPSLRPLLGYVQFPQRFHGINKTDIYASEYKRLFQINPLGMDGLQGPPFVGTGCFFSRRAFFGGPTPSAFVSPESCQLFPTHVTYQTISSIEITLMAQQVAGCNYENDTVWGSKMGFKYGSLVEDYYTGYRLQCEGWRSVLCNPKRPAFLGDTPNNLSDALLQNKRWTVGLLEACFCHYSPLSYGWRAMGHLMALSYAHYICWPFWSIPITLYALLTPLALLSGTPIFPHPSDPWCLLYLFLFLGSYGYDLVEFMTVGGGPIRRWWNDQRMWMIRGLSSYIFGILDYILQAFGVSSLGFELTNKAADEQQGKRYEQGVFEFGGASTMFVPLTTAAIINLAALLWFVFHVEATFMGQGLVVASVVVNCCPIYEAMLLRNDKGKIPLKITLISLLLAWALYVSSALLL